MGAGLGICVGGLLSEYPGLALYLKGRLQQSEGHLAYCKSSGRLYIRVMASLDRQRSSKHMWFISLVELVDTEEQWKDSCSQPTAWQVTKQSYLPH